ncbi:MAG: sulfatase-like hydrolase/transferase [Planctomycetota bacterium]|jgi:hypothetical protein
MSSAARSAYRAGAPLALASAAWGLWVLRPGLLIAALPLLYCPGWGLLRILSVVDRHFVVTGASFALSALVLGLVARLGVSLGFTIEQVGLLAHLVSLALCIVGGLRLASHDRRQARVAPHPDPMPLWPRRSPFCLAVLALALGAVVWAAPLGSPPTGTGYLDSAARASAWLTGGEEPLLAGVAQPATELLPAAAGALAAASGQATLIAVQLLDLAALAAALLLVAEGVSRLRGNRGGTRAMLALLLGLNPLAAWFLLGAAQGERNATALTAGFDPALTTALQPFLDGTAHVLALAFTALLLSATLSVLRRASYHMPRVAGAAALGLAVASPSAAVLLLPGWLLGIGLAHIACRDSPDNEPPPSNSSRRPGEPIVLRAPFWALAWPITVGAAAGLWIAGLPEVSTGLVNIVAWGLLAALGPTCVLFFPGVRHLNRSPGREAWFFIGLILLTVLMGVLLGFPGDRGELVVRLLALVLAVPIANGAVSLVEQYGRRASLALTLLVTFLLIAPAAVLREHGERIRPLRVDGETGKLLVQDAPLAPDLVAALRDVARRAPADAVLVPPEDVDDEWLAAVALLAERPLLGPARELTTPVGSTERVRARLAARLHDGAEAALLAVRGLPGLHARELWAVHGGDAWPGFENEGAHGPLSVARARVGHVLLVTVAGLRADRLNPGALPRIAPLLETGALFTRAITPLPASRPALASLLTGRSPAEHGLLSPGQTLAGHARTLAEEYAARGYRTAAVLTLEPTAGLERGFQSLRTRPGAGAEQVVDAAFVRLAEADPRPLFLWLHLSDPMDAPAGDRRAYDEAVSVVDRSLARVLRSLRRNDLVVLTAPHGRALPGDTAPGLFPAELLEPTLAVPLLLAGSGLHAGREPGLIGLADVAGLLLRGALPRRERIALLEPGDAGWAGRVFGERRPDRKTLVLPATSAGTSRSWSFDLATDPTETRPVLADEQVSRALAGRARLAHP